MLWQARKADTINTNTPHYLQNSQRYLNQVWHVDVLLVLEKFNTAAVNGRYNGGNVGK